MPETIWPAGVIARYLTAGGATVDLTITEQPHRHDDGITGYRNSTRAVCTGCPAAQEFPHHRIHRGSYSEWEKHEPQAAETDARAWAQSHAETCRAMPLPVS